MRFYTRDLPTAIAQRRVDEIAADLHHHMAHERTHGRSDRRIALSILSRMVRGLAADASWRRQVGPLKGNLMKPVLAVLAAAIIAAAIGVAAIVYGGADDAPGLQLIGTLFVAGAVVLGVRTVRSR